MNIFMQVVCKHTFFTSLKYLRVELLGHRVELHFSFLRNSKIFVQTDCTGYTCFVNFFLLGFSLHIHFSNDFF